MATEMDKMGGAADYERLGARRLKLVDVIAQSVGLIGPVFSAAFLIPLIAGFGFSGEGAGVATPFAVIVASIGVLALGWIVAQYAKRVHAAGSLYDYVTMGLGSRAGAWAWRASIGRRHFARRNGCSTAWALVSMRAAGFEN